MIVFSELLKSFINEKNISVKKLAANVQMDRTLIQKYMSGSRVPKNYREVQKLADGMMLLPESSRENCWMRITEIFTGTKRMRGIGRSQRHWKE